MVHYEILGNSVGYSIQDNIHLESYFGKNGEETIRLEVSLLI